MGKAREWCVKNGFILLEAATAWAVVMSPGGTVSRMPWWCFKQKEGARL
jgi:hypothetical protein